RGNAFENINPSPSGEPEPGDVVADPLREGSADYVRQWHGRHESRHRLGPMFGLEPDRQVHYDGGEKSPLEEPEHESQKVELALSVGAQAVPMSGNGPQPGYRFRLGDMRQPTEQCFQQGHAHEAHQRGDNAPQNEDAAKDPACSPALDAQGAGDFKNPVTPEKDAAAKTDDFVIKAEPLLLDGQVHAELGDRNVRPV